MRRYLLEAALSVGALAGLLCVVVAIVSVAFGLSPLVFRSDSMSPTIDVGDVAIARSVPADELAAGDIVSVSRADGTRITHRVVSIDSRVGNSTTMTLRGDANSVNDSAPYTVTSADRVVFRIPALGYMLSWFANPFSWAMATLLTLGLLFAAFRPDKRFRKVSQGRHSATPSSRARRLSMAVQVVVVLTVVATAVTGYARTNGTLAALTDSATATGTVTAGRPEVPTSLNCTNVSTGFLTTSARLSWPNPANHRTYDYQLVFSSNGSGGTTTIVPATSADPVTLTVDRSYVSGTLGLGLGGSYTVELRSKVGNFLSSGKLTITVTTFLNSVSCGSSSGTASQSAAANARSAPAQAAAPETTTTTSAAPTTTSTPAPTTAAPTTSAQPPTSTAPPAASASDVSSPSGTYVASSSGGTVVIRDKASGAEQYGSDLKATKVEWADDSTLKVTGDDGTATTVTRSGSTWTSSSSTPTAAAAG